MTFRFRSWLADRNGLPLWANRAIDNLAERPNSIFGRLAALRYGRTPRGVVVSTSEFRAERKRLLIAPMNYSGQGREWGRAVERDLTDIAVTSMAVEVPGGFSFEADLVVPVPTYQNDKSWQLRQFDAVAANATHTLIEALEPPFGRAFGRDVERQAHALLARGVSVAMMCHGTEIRLPSRHVQATTWSLYNDPAVYTPRLEQIAQRNSAILQRLRVPVFVSTPDLLDDVPTAAWCPVVVDRARWEVGDDRGHSDGPVRVFHAPSISIHKGTPLIIDTLLRLQREGVIEYQESSRVASAAMPARYAQTDVFLDQFRVGSYGVAACEAMAAGCAVVGHVTDRVRDYVLNSTGLPLPIIEANPLTIESVLRALNDDRTRRATVSEEGRKFVETVHDGRMSARILAEQWLAPREVREQ